MPIYWNKDKGRWHHQFNRVIAGRRYRASKLLPSGWSRSQAEKYDREQVARLYAIATGVDKPIPLISEAVRLYLDNRIPHLRNGAVCAQNLALLLPWYSGRRLDELTDVATKYAKEARLEKTGEPLQPATLRNRLAYLRSAVRYAWKHHGLGEQDYGARMAMPRVDNARHVYLRTDELAVLLSHVDDHETRALVRLAFYTGMRWVSELLPRQPEDIVKDGADWWLVVGTTKTGRPDMKWIHPAARRDLSFLPFRHHWRTYYARFEEAKRAAGMPHLHMHDLRHSLASVLISQGATLAEVGGALGHSSSQSTARYAHLYPERIAAVVGKVPTVANKPKTKKSKNT